MKMHLRKTIPYLGAAIAVLLYSCTKEDTISKSPNADEPCAEQRAAGHGQVIPGQYIIGIKRAIGARAISETAVKDIGRTVLERNDIAGESIRGTFAGETSGFVANLSIEQASALRQDESVSIVEPDRIVALATCFEIVEPKTISWNIHKVGYGNGTGKTAWIIDSGIDMDHPDLNVDATRSRSFISGKPSPDDENGHGTHVAGIIGARNNTFGMLGVASNANLVSLRVLGADGVGSLSAIIQALGYASANGRPGDVINMSLGDEGISQILDEQVQNTANKGIYIAIAAGNDNRPAIEFSPARANGINIFTVSAVDSLNRFASFSNYGNDVVDFAAPGVRIPSTYSNGRYALLSGTSMAAPHVAGLLLLNGRNIRSSGTAINDPDGEPDRIAHQ